MKYLFLMLMVLSMPIMAENGCYGACETDFAPINYFDKNGEIKPYIPNYYEVECDVDCDGKCVKINLDK